MKRTGNKFTVFLWHLQDLYHQLKPCRFSFIVALIGGAIFLCVDQGTEVLRALAEAGSLTGATNVARFSAFWIGLLIWCLVSWYTARVLLYFDFATSEDWHPDREGWWLGLHNWSQRNVPRILGAAPAWLVGISLLRARGTYEANPPPTLLYGGICAIAGGFVLWILFVLRRSILKRSHLALTPPQTIPSELGEMERTSHFVLGTMAFLSLLLLLLFTLNPVRCAGSLGTGAILMFAAASWAFWGSALIYFGSRHHLPVLTFLALWIVLCSFNNDNHEVRTIARGNPTPAKDIATALRDWHMRINQKYPGRTVQPLFIVASEGGGIRAAYWTASVLGSLQDAEPSFADHVFVISGVSGGSVGGAVFAALVASPPPPGKMAETAQTMLGQDFLSPAIAAMLYPDFLQRFIPWPFPYLDRGRWLEQSWEQSWRHATHNNRFAEPLLDLWNDPNSYVPALLLNGTSVETGNRVIVSNMAINSDYLAAEEGASKYESNLDLPLSTAAHLSARFTYVSPAGRFARDGSHVVDGGYFENSGATTALDILRQVNREITAPDSQMEDVIPKLIMISNDPRGAGAGTRTVAAAKDQSDKAPTTKRDSAHNKPGQFLEDALAPVFALLSTRDARGIYAQREIGEAQKTFYEKLSRKDSASDKTQVYFFSLAPAPVPLPLGWMLSNGAARSMQEELYDRGASKTTNVQTWNKAMREQIVASLGGKTP
ncbi:MAG: patatin-like phospholipase family protein [Chthoniobacterales bacterium]|nr:patatin-like phospholipase family protein [Chthoniobacterales bacterium]